MNIWFDFIGNEVFIYDSGIVTKSTRIYKDEIIIVNHNGVDYLFK